MTRCEVIEYKVWVHASGRKASIYGALPWISKAEESEWTLTRAGWTVRDNVTNTVGFGRVPFETEAPAHAFADEVNAKDAENAKRYEKTLIARWESKSGKHFAELNRDSMGYSYRGNGAGGFMGAMPEADALASIEARVDSGYFLPDNAKTPMKRTR